MIVVFWRFPDTAKTGEAPPLLRRCFTTEVGLSLIFGAPKARENPVSLIYS